MDFAGAEQAFCTLTYDQTRSVTIAQKIFNKVKKKNLLGTKKNVKKWHFKFVATVATLATAHMFKTHFDNNQHDSVSRASLALDMKRSSLHRILQSS